MATIPRLPRPGDDWNQNDLHSYDIRLEFQDTQTFFGETSLPTPSIQQDILTASDAKATVNDESYNLLAQIESATNSSPSEPSNAVVDFSVSLFHSMGYITRPRVIKTWSERQFYIGSKMEGVHSDICITDNATGRDVLLCQENRSRTDPHARLIIAAIAAYQEYNLVRRAELRPQLDTMIIPGIIMFSSSPSFFKIPVTSELAECVEDGRFPSTPTIVAGHVPDIPKPETRFNDGMMNLDNRRIFLQSFEAFKQFLV
ncbi:hypothetical protein BDN70DRAFT_293031 [Pholiota conissans]|uniref:Uncharacterized protein n=1 Tax=Pholiota conissans TaxID=109636 RepID=A0A9P6CX29_9AGAR|nr:hypothetical protein BDN70DRAFT_293031 [Pholiota conissans]